MGHSLPRARDWTPGNTFDILGALGLRPMRSLRPQTGIAGKLAKPRSPIRRASALCRGGTPHLLSVTSAAAPTIRAYRGTTSSAFSRAHHSMSGVEAVAAQVPGAAARAESARPRSPSSARGGSPRSRSRCGRRRARPRSAPRSTRRRARARRGRPRTGPRRPPRARAPRPRPRRGSAASRRRRARTSQPPTTSSRVPFVVVRISVSAPALRRDLARRVAEVEAGDRREAPLAGELRRPFGSASARASSISAQQRTRR